jgi:hypothetical protein
MSAKVSSVDGRRPYFCWHGVGESLAQGKPDCLVVDDDKGRRWFCHAPDLPPGEDLATWLASATARAQALAREAGLPPENAVACYRRAATLDDLRRELSKS